MNLHLAEKDKAKMPSLKNTHLWNSLQAKWHYHFGKTEEAISNWVDLLKRDLPKVNLKVARCLIETQAFQEVRDYLEGLESGYHEKNPEICYLLARCYMGQALIPQAKGKIEQAIRAQPQNARYWELLADCHLELGEWREAVGALNNSLRAAPQQTETNYRLGVIYAYHGLNQEALLCLQGCCKLQPRSSLYWETKAELHLRLEQLDEACHSFAKALHYGRNPDLTARLAYCYVQNDQIAKGIKYYKQTLKYEPDHYDALSNLAAVYQNLGRTQEALDLLERAQNIYPTDPILLNNYAFTLMHRGCARKAVEYYRQALELAPEQPLILYNLSVCLARKGNWQESIDLLNVLIKNDPDNSAGWTLLGNVYEQLDQHETAIDCFNKALKLA